MKPEVIALEASYQMAFYTISCKHFEGAFKYGKSLYDFNEGTLIFTAPHQVVSASHNLQMDEGWGLFFHSDLINGTALGRKINQYGFFGYEANEALHISDDEKQILKDCIEKIKKEYSQNIDKHTEALIVSNLELLLNYCNRFHDRQFLTRSKVNKDIVQRFEHILNEYFAQETLIEAGLPDVKFFAFQLNLSPNYLSDLLNRFTGKTTQEHIHLKLVDAAKSLLWSTEKSISEIAYELGFEYPSHFTKVFRTKTGLTPQQYRNTN
ncbi:helix-turn-helix domain-containing protein [Dyadobacter arcticus]|uniref:AraC-like DNA-binding protein n=1 Tax=Dyadobacter arcticus TaxID=1078754 RepID=A0ABX0URN7_9BACT|nr:AraC family transcriptional regulator [Dyadobacter arcticus]NIJ54579.1 AraC-like DNA-binding protein [Dyadobacter arcticus]